MPHPRRDVTVAQQYYAECCLPATGSSRPGGGAFCRTRAASMLPEAKGEHPAVVVSKACSYIIDKGARGLYGGIGGQIKSTMSLQKAHWIF